jgi:ribosomal protein L29
MAEIAAEMAAGKMPYSPSGRGPNIQMVLWRAGLSPSFLETKGVDETRDKKQAERKAKILEWKRSLLGLKQPHLNANDEERNASAQLRYFEPSGGDVDEYRQYIHDLELELVEAQAKIAELEEILAEQKATITVLRSKSNSFVGSPKGSDRTPPILPLES